MTLQVLAPHPYTFLPSGILIVEPHKGLLAARSMLLAAADYYVGVSGFTVGETPRTDPCEVAIAILSESLGCAALSATAQVVRRNWPRARILIVGRSRAAIEDNLYDVRIDHRASPEDLLAVLVMLSETPWKQRSRAATLEEDRADRLLDCGTVWEIAESDPTKHFANKAEKTYSRDMPSQEQHFRPAS